MVSFNAQVPSSPYQGYYQNPATTQPAPSQPATPAPTQPVYQAPRGISPEAAIDLIRVTKHPILTVKSLITCTRDLIAMKATHNVSVASADAVMGQFQTAKAHLDQAPFKNLLPFFDHALDKWADARFTELKPQVEAQVTQRAWHPVTLEWPDGGSGSDRLTELDMLRRTTAAATDGQIVRALMGMNRLQVKNSTAMDYFYPVARANDALILRRNLPLVPGQKSIEANVTDLLNQVVQVHAEVQ